MALLVCPLAISGWSSLALAEGPCAQVVTRSSGMRTAQVVRSSASTLPGSRVSYIVTRGIVEPAAIVSRQLANQPVYTHLAEVQVDHATVYIDPDVDYRRQNRHMVMPDNHWLMEAQRAQNVVAAKQRSRIVTNPNGVHGGPHPYVSPRMIILKPDLLDRRAQPRNKVKKAPIPNVPASPDTHDRLKTMAMAD